MYDGGGDHPGAGGHGPARLPGQAGVHLAAPGGALLRRNEQSIQTPAPAAGPGVHHLRANRGPEAGIPAGRHHKIPVGAAGQQLHRNGADAVSPRQYRVHLLPGGLPHGLRLLRQHRGRKGPGPDRRGDAGPGAVYPAGFRPGDLQYRADGYWRAPGQPGQRAALSAAGEPSRRAEHRHAPYQPVHLRRGAGDRRPGGGGPAADAVGVPPRAGQRDPVPDHAGEPGLGRGGAVCRLPPVFSPDRAAHIL